MTVSRRKIVQRFCRCLICLPPESRGSWAGDITPYRYLFLPISLMLYAQTYWEGSLLSSHTPFSCHPDTFSTSVLLWPKIYQGSVPRNFWYHFQHFFSNAKVSCNWKGGKFERWHLVFPPRIVTSLALTLFPRSIMKWVMGYNSGHHATDLGFHVSSRFWQNFQE